MSRHPAPEELLLDYAAGALPAGPALAVALHAALDPAAQRLLARLDALGGALLEGEEGAALDDAMLDRALAKLDSVAIEPRPAPAKTPAGFEWAPAPLVRHLPSDARWRRAFGGFDEIRLALGGGDHRVSLLRLEPGKGLPMHQHTGSEYTVVLQGGYTDATGSYAAGDFAVGPGEEQHQPIADPGEPCIALIVLERPIVLTGAVGRWFNPLVRRGWI